MMFDDISVGVGLFLMSKTNSHWQFYQLIVDVMGPKQMLEVFSVNKRKLIIS